MIVDYQIRVKHSIWHDYVNNLGFVVIILMLLLFYQEHLVHYEVTMNQKLKKLKNKHSFDQLESTGFILKIFQE
eukprot:CAMPEP_0196767922 /NCGR_PEP_ID=MMETSP1095-20130614/42126_1 /TAXON_ID=96789 ORGANISM="Chromulina nebulosa, Strain UTEXLB2642" /NCGR_SAMPLE_ID=MMETSP1095 /ASSEMBLY_ACC=CAM_ASM_000446 /LENGTH=73 /DNA_ID=CAMNT_0042136769 /DNA_START=330 /DNA_END=551 /DNA_ORIENTATION=-